MNVRSFPFRLSVALVFGIVSLQAAGAEPEQPRPHAKVGVLQPDEVQWTSGFWKDRVDTCHAKMIPGMWEIMKGTHYKPFYQHFKIAAGLAEGRHRGAKWNDGDFYKWMEAVCYMLAVKPNAEWEGRLNEIIATIAKAQRKDGYIHTPILIAARNGDENAKPFSDRFAFEIYNMGHLITAACVHHRVTGKDNFLAVARKSADFLESAFRNPTSEEARHAICPSHYMGIVDLFRVTGDPKHLELAKHLLKMRDLVEDGGDDNQDRVPLARQREAVGHAVRANYLFAGSADLCAECGDGHLWEPLERIWENVVQKKMYITGGCGALYDGASPDGSKKQGVITRVHQAYGRNYQLPNVTAHNETCANIGNVLWNWRMFLVSGEAKYVDVAELALYNSVLSGVDLGGTNYFYTNPLRQLDEMPADLRWSRTRVPFVTSYCCPPNLVRTIAGVGGMAYGKSKDALWVNLYGSNSLRTRLAGNPLTVVQESAYPWEGGVKMTIKECGTNPFALKLRVPGWCEGAHVKLNGQGQNVPTDPGTYLELRRTWKAGDTVELEMPMPAQLIEAHPLVEEARNEVAVKRGPIVYCLESNDLPKGIRISDVRVPRNIELKPRFASKLLYGVGVVEGKASARNLGDWDGKLYRPLNKGRSTQFSARFIPYYAWSNRGKSEMSVLGFPWSRKPN